MFPTKDRNAERLTKGFHDHFVDVLIIHEYLISTAAYLVFRTTVPVSPGSCRMKKLREFVHNKCKTYLESLRLSEQISNTLRIPTSIFVEVDRQ